MGNNNSRHKLSPLESEWGSNNTQTFTIEAHKNKIFGCDVILPNAENTNELWIASCSADGRIIINEITLLQKNNISEITSSNHSLSYTSPCTSPSLSSNSSISKSFSSISLSPKPKLKTKTIKNTKNKFNIEINRILSLPLDSTICYTLTLHPNTRYIATCINTILLIFEIDITLKYPIYHQVKYAKKYLSGAKFIDDKHIIFSSGDGNIYIYNFIEKLLISVISNKSKKDIICMDHCYLKCMEAQFGEKQIIAFATLDKQIYIYDITNIMNNASDLMVYYKYKPILIQKMKGQFGSDISCLNISPNGRFIAIGSEDNSYNIYNISIKNPAENNYIVDVQWILLCKQILVNDKNMVRVKWINNNTVISSCDKGKQLYLSKIFDVKYSKMIIDLLNEKLNEANILHQCKHCKIIKQIYNNNDMRFIVEYIINIIIQYIKWIILHHSIDVDFDDHISCIGTCQNVNNGKGFVVIGGFSNKLQCFLPL